MAKADITMYGADWCGDCRRSKRLFEELDIQVNHIDVEADATAAAKVVEINGERNQFLSLSSQMEHTLRSLQIMISRQS